MAKDTLTPPPTPAGPGPAVDVHGQPAIDPTKNVLDLVNAAIKRQDDIREIWQEASQRELGLRQEMRQREHRDLQELLETRLDGMDRAQALLSETVNRAPTEITREVSHLRGILDERLASVDRQFQEQDRLTSTQFRERDTRSEREARDNKLAVDAAFAAQEKQAVAQNEGNQLAISKSESATAETIKTNQELAKSEINALRKSAEDQKQRQSEVDEDLKRRIGANEAALVGISKLREGATETRTDSRAATSTGLLIAGVVLSVMTIVSSIVLALILKS